MRRTDATGCSDRKIRVRNHAYKLVCMSQSHVTALCILDPYLPDALHAVY